MVKIVKVTLNRLRERIPNYNSLLELTTEKEDGFLHITAYPLWIGNEDDPLIDLVEMIQQLLSEKKK